MQRASFRVTSDSGVLITVYDEMRAICGQGEGGLQMALQPGSYRVHFERGEIVHKEIVAHVDATELVRVGPSLRSPAPFAGAVTSRPDHVEPARELSLRDTGRPLGAPPHASRLFVFLRRATRDAHPRRLPGEPVTIHDVAGRLLATISRDNARIDEGHGYVAYSCQAAPGTYRLRSARSRRDVAITIPRDRAAHVFVVDAGVVRLDELRVSLVPAGARFDPDSPIWSAMESVIAALRMPDQAAPAAARALPAAARALLPEAAAADLCFGIAAAHVLRRCSDPALADVMAHLARFRELPDVAVLERIHARPAPPAAMPDSPPLLSESLALAMTRPELAAHAISPSCALAQAARTHRYDSIWCTWSTRTWDERWIEPTVERVRARSRPLDAAAVARDLALPRQTIEQALRALDAAMPGGDGPRRDDARVVIPGYTLGEVLGRGAWSTVVRATRGDGREVALKLVPAPGGAGPSPGLDREPDPIEPVVHPRIIARAAQGSLPGDAGRWLEMERCRGSALDLLAEADAPLPVATARGLILDALDGLAALHARGIAHGAITPGNLLVRDDGSAAIAAPGLVTSARAAGAGAAPRDPRFAPPELVTPGGQPRPASDVWSMAATLYFLLTLEPPRDTYAGQSELEAAHNPIIPIAARRPELPDELARWIDRALSSEVGARPRDALAFREQLAASGVTCAMPLARGDLAETGDLANAAQLLYGFCFDPVELETPKLSYEPRWSCQCPRDCAAAWVASKSGDVMRVGLATPDGRPKQTWFPGNREARTIYHQHDGRALGGGSFLLIGRDNGALDIIPDRHPDWSDRPSPQRDYDSPGSFHLHSWWERRAEVEELAIDQGFDRAHDIAPEYAGVTAIAVLPRRGPPDTLEILVATRYPSLYVIEATCAPRPGSRSRLRLLQRVDMPGWIEWIIAPQGGDDRVVCISRGGDIVRFRRGELLAGGAGQPTALSLLPTAAMPFGALGVLLGTTTGLFLVRGDPPEAIAMPVTRSPVLCLDRAAMERGGIRRDYVVMGLEDGRLRVVGADLLRALASGVKIPKISAHSFALDLPAAVLAVEAFRPDDGPRDAAYVVAVLRDHSVRLFQVTSEDTQRARAKALWDDHVRRAAGTSTARFADELAAASAARLPGCDDNAWRYMRVDVVLPELCKAAADAGARGQLIELACSVARGADLRVLHRLSVVLEQLAAGDVMLLLELSRSILAAVPHGDDRRWSSFIDSHLRELHALTHRFQGPDRTRLVAWARFVRKYVLLGTTFSHKQTWLLDLVSQNHETHKHLDALIYQALVSERGYDLRWDVRVDEDVFGLHTADCGDGRTIVVAVTVDGQLAFFDGATGSRLKIQDAGRVRDELMPYGGARTLACAVARVHSDQLRVVLACSGMLALSPGLAVFDLRWPASDPGAVRILDEVLHVDCADARARVYALQPLPDQADAFAVGLETRDAPVGLLQLRAGCWTLEVRELGDGERVDATGRPVERRAPGKVPTRALAVARVDESASGYLVVAGSDDGVVRAISFGRGVPARDWKLASWDGVAEPVTAVALGRHWEVGSRDRDKILFSCYLGTAAGETFALSILAHSESSTSSFDYDAQPLWRETHGSPIVAAYLWRTPLYRPEEVLVVVTGTGRLCIYNHSYLKRDRISVTLNYYFRGMRFDRVAMPGGVRALGMVEGRRTFVAAGADRRLYMGSLAYLRDSVDPIDALPRDRPARAQRAFDAPRVGAGLPRELWARLHHLLGQSRHHEPLAAGAMTEDQIVRLKLELCDLIRLDGGALSSYALRERLVYLEPWDGHGELALIKKAYQLLLPLDPEKLEDAARIKVILKSLCRARLFHDPDAFRAVLLESPEASTDRRPETAATCEVMAEYLTLGLARSTPAAARLRIVIIKELLRVPVLRYMAAGDPCAARVRRAIKRALETCLADDDRLVRIEALRALSVMLRNAGVMADPAVDPDGGSRGRRRRSRRKVIDALFPDGLGSLEWILELIVAGLQQFPGFTRHTAMRSGAWYYISPLLHLFRIFPDRTLALCDYLIRAGLGVEVVGACFLSLRRGAAMVRKRIEYLYLLPVLERTHARTEYIERYAQRGRGRASWDELQLRPCKPPKPDRPWHEDRPWHAIDDDAMAGRLTWLLDRLARMWSVSSRERHEAIANLRIARTDRRAPLGALEDMVVELAAVARELVSANPGAGRLEGLAKLSTLYSSSVEGNAALTAPVRTIVSGIIATWRDIYDPPRVEEGKPIGSYKLGTCLSDRGRASVFSLVEPADRKHKHVIKVLRRSDVPDAPRRFLDGAALNKKLCKRSPHRDYIVPIVYVHGEPPYAYVMRKYDKTLEDCLTGDFQGHRAWRWTEKTAEHIGRALQAAHGSGYHGNVKATNILVRMEKRRDDHAEPVFCLGDFGLADAPEDSAGAGPAGIVPSCLSHKYAGDPDGRRKWDDIAALSLVLYRMLTGATVDPRRTTDLRGHLKRLCKLAADLGNAGGVRAVADTLIRVFDDREPVLDIQAFLAAIASAEPRPIPVLEPPPPEVRPPWIPAEQHAILFLAANPDGKLQLDKECRAIETELRGTPYGRSHFTFHPKFAVNIHDMEYHLLEKQPMVIHFSGHGSATDLEVPRDPSPLPRDIQVATSGIQLLGDQRVSRHVSGAQLAELIRTTTTFKNGRIVVLNACFTDELAEALLGVVECVIGMRGPIFDDAARDFAIAFYCGLGCGRSVGEAFQQARAVLGEGRGEPVIRTRAGLSADQLTIVTRT